MAVIRTPVCIAVALLLAVPHRAQAQAWAPPGGVGSISFIYERIDNTGHRRSKGVLLPKGRSLDMTLYFQADYAFTDRVSVSVGLPYVFAKYTDLLPPPPPIPFLPGDKSGKWQSGWQDFGLTTRYSLVGSKGGAFALTPFVAIGAPGHDYNFRGETALGRNLNEVRIGAGGGWHLDAVSRNLSVEGSYSYAFVEEVMDISTNRSNASLEGNYLIKGKLLVRGQLLWQRTHGGLRFGSPQTSPPTVDLVFPGEVNTEDLLYQHDRIMRDNYWHAGIGLGYSFPHVALFADYIAFVGGTDTHAGRVFTIGLSVPFRVGGARR